MRVLGSLSNLLVTDTNLHNAIVIVVLVVVTFS